MLRIFRTKFRDLKEAEIELRRVKIIETYLSPNHLARSDEFLVDYTNNGQKNILLCGLQEYVEGEILNPWGPLNKEHLVSLLGRMASENALPFSLIAEQWIQKLQKSAKGFIDALKKIIIEKHHVPDLAGVGNLLVTRFGEIKLVDINNISEVALDTAISLDDRGYPVCDKSIEALFLLEKGFTGKYMANDHHIFEIFLEPGRMRRVKKIETEFYSCWKRNSLSPLR